MKVETIDTLKKWNISRQAINDDTRFLRLLLLEVFTAHVLIKSSVKSLDADKIRFTRGLYALLLLFFDRLFQFPFYCHLTDIFLKRVGDNTARASRFNSICDAYCEHIRNKNNNKKWLQSTHNCKTTFCVVNVFLLTHSMCWSQEIFLFLFHSKLWIRALAPNIFFHFSVFTRKLREIRPCLFQYSSVLLFFLKIKSFKSKN